MSIRWNDGAILAHSVPFYPPESSALSFFSYTAGGRRSMSTGEGKRRFAAYAKANNIIGAESDDSTPRHARFKKAARLPNPEDVATGSKVQEKGSNCPPEKSRGRSRDRKRSSSFNLRRREEDAVVPSPEQSGSSLTLHHRQDPPLEPQGEDAFVGRPKTPAFERRRDSGYGGRQTNPVEVVQDDDEGKGSDLSTISDEQENESAQEDTRGKFHPSFLGGGGAPPLK